MDFDCSAVQMVDTLAELRFYMDIFFQRLAVVFFSQNLDTTICHLGSSREPNCRFPLKKTGLFLYSCTLEK